MGSPTLSWTPPSGPGQTPPHPAVEHPLPRDASACPRREGGREAPPALPGAGEHTPNPPTPLRGQAQHRRSQTPHPLPVFCLHSGKPSRLAKMCCPPPGDVICLPWIRTFVDSRGAHGGGGGDGGGHGGQKKNISCVRCSFLDLKTLKCGVFSIF